MHPRASHRPAPSQDAWLIRVEIDRAGCRCGDEVFTQPEVVIGRDPASDLMLWCTLVSRRHARILRSGRSLAIEDLGSHNGVLVNGERVQWALLRPGDLVTVGTFGLRVSLVACSARRPGLEPGTDDEVTEETTEEWGRLLRRPRQLRDPT
ncbi:MAG TPA: FHA domain-containing protein [Myxococcota bacterium]|nr:FHA domain-containing protein [Myxococcota bacterium]HRY97187.1 FHA domain-containing protein [Myxococcota bacterium]HSA21778.1 FHA domain-containing protein [Myxococcota bacterium]